MAKAVEIKEDAPEQKEKPQPIKPSFDPSKQDFAYLKPSGFGFYSKKEVDTKPQMKNIIDICNQLLKHKPKITKLEDGSISFNPSPHLSKKDISTKLLKSEIFTNSKRFKEIMNYINCNHVEYSFEDYNKQKVVYNKSCLNSFIIMLEYGYYKHYPVVIKPNDLWLTILYSVSVHVSENAEKLRNNFVEHKGKKQLVIQRPTFVKGSNKNDWNGVINEFVQLINNNTKDEIVKIFESNFTSSTLADKLAVRVTTMDIMKEYFEYVMMCGCGFPEITLKGKKSDWILLKNKTKTLLNTKLLPQFGKKWSNALLPLIDHFIDAYDGKINCMFWNSALKTGANRGSSMPRWDQPDIGDDDAYYSGWINILFPYSENKKEGTGGWGGSSKNDKKKEGKATYRENSYCVPYSDTNEYACRGLNGRYCRGMNHNNFLLGIGNAPVKYVDLSTKKTYDLSFIAGFFGVLQDQKTLQLSTNVGYFIAEKK